MVEASAASEASNGLATLQAAGLATLPTGWSVRSLASMLADDRGISVGVMYPGRHTPGGIPLIKVGDIENNGLIATPAFCISPEVHYEYRRTALDGGELLLTLVGAVGQCAIVPPSAAGWNAARALAVLRLSAPSDAAFVRLCLLSRPLQHLMRMWATTTVQATLNLKETRQLPLPWPPRPTRDAIARILGALDDKIELNRKTNETLEAMARALFKSWFVDFDPVRAKMKGAPPEGMDAETRALFPTAFDRSAIGHVPRGWCVDTLDTLVELRRGHDLPSKSRRPGVIPIVSSGGISGSHDVAQARAPGIVTGRYGTLGRVFLMEEDYWPLNTTLYSSDMKDNEPTYVFYALTRVDFAKYSDKGAVPGINRNHLHMEQVIVPPAEIQRAFGRSVGVWHARARAYEAESVTLSALRDTLLPKLMSGELRVRDAERVVGAAT